jgi:NitT/TauT family transport system substrate-binding protein
VRRGPILATLAGGFATSIFTRPACAQTAQLDKVRLATPFSDAITPQVYAQRSGLYKRYGLDVEIVTLNSGTAAVAAMIGGTYDLANSSLLAMIDAYLSGVPLVLAAPNAVFRSSNPTALLQMAPDSTLRSGADLNGKIVGCGALGDLNELSASAWIDKTGGDSKGVKFVELPQATIEDAIVAHRVEAAVLLQPALDASLADGKTKTLGDAYGAIAPTFMYSAWAALGTWADQHADVLKRFIHATAESVRYTNVHQAETAPMMADVTKIPLPVMLKMRRAINATSMDPAMMQPLIDAEVRYHRIKHGFAARDMIWKGAI